MHFKEFSLSTVTPFVYSIFGNEENLGLHYNLNFFLLTYVNRENVLVQ